MEFHEAFRDVAIREDLDGAFSGVSVDSVSFSKKRGDVTVFISAGKPVEHRYVSAMETLLSRQLFDGAVSIHFEERYSLGLGVEEVFDSYRNSILDELAEQGKLYAKIFDESEMRFSESGVTLQHEDGFIARDRLERIARWLPAMLEKRFSLPVQVFTKYTEPVELEDEGDGADEGARDYDYEYETVSAEELARWNDVSERGNSGRDDLGVSISKEVLERDGAEKLGGSAKGNAPGVTISKEILEGDGAAKLDGSAKGNAPGVTISKEELAKGSPAKSSGVAKDKPRQKSPFRRKKLPDDPSIFYGRNFEGKAIPISEITDEIGEVIVRGKVMKSESRETRTGRILILFTITDFTDSISAKLFTKPEAAPDVMEGLKEGGFVEMKGVAMFDSYEKEIGIGSIAGIRKIADFTEKRMDLAPEKRVELHLHTIMSEMDAVINVKPLLETLSEWGHKAVAITDHGVVQSFTDAFHAKEKLKLKDFKIIYGVEAYLVDDLVEPVRNPGDSTLADAAVVFDLETTGFGPKNSRILEIGAVKVKNGEVIDKFSTFVNPEVPIPAEITKLTSITYEMVANAPKIEVALPDFFKFCEGCVLVAHNASFDTSFIFENARRLGISKTPDDFAIVDTVEMARILIPGLKNYKLDTVAEEVGASLDHHHRAVDDAGCTAEIYIKLAKKAEENFGAELALLNEHVGFGADVIKKMGTSHAIILAKNDLGRINLYRLISESHLNYFARRPRIPKSLLVKYREGLILGSACEAGELYQAILKGHGADEVARLCNFYDYYEIQPLGNNRFMIGSEKFPDVNSDLDLMDINRKIVALGEEYGKPVVATTDAHFMNPGEEVYRSVITGFKHFDKDEVPPPLYLRTTEEMLDEFSYLGEEKAYEVVVKNTNLIADMIEDIKPVRPDKCPPVIPDSDKTLREICYNRAHEIYGEDLPPQVSERLEHELTSIISNGFAVMYIIAQKLVWKSNEDGYLVGSRGSVGSSFVAFMAGITEVNSLPAHYHCPNCHYSDFDSEEVKGYSGRSGCDMPDKACPVCGKMLIKDGHDIPFETFLGFNGDKEPDIDLNFSGEYQSVAHAYTEVIFGKGQTFRAGTIGGVAEKTAFGYVKKYLENTGRQMRSAEMERIAKGCIGVRRTTGQHPGGIVVLPLGENIYSFTPLQHPANDQTTPIITTHFDYHSIDHNLLKLDILGHDDPTMIRMLEDITGVDAKTIRLDDEKVLSLFTGLSALGLEPADIDGYDLGSLGVPEFGTDFVMQMLRDTRPSSFSELVRISGLSHGTDVWLGNAQTLIQEGKCTLSTAICTRDDIMIYLINMGLDPGHSFKIMESVRKGKGLTDEQEAEMKEHGVPDWYIWSCKKIKYMFPKAHAAAYVMMGFRVAYFKVYYPLAYYAAFFSIRATAFDYVTMCQGKERLLSRIAELKKLEHPTAREDDELRDSRIVLEMYARGFSFLPISLYESDAKEFKIVGDKLLPPFLAIEGMGDKAAASLAAAAKDGPFLSKDDVKDRAKGVTQTVMEKMDEMGLLAGLSETNQISFFDFV